MERKDFKTSRRVFFLTAISLVLVISGCGGNADDDESGSDGTSEGQSSNLLKYPSDLSGDSSPEEVAAVLIRALDEKDKETLLGLVAAKAGARKIDAIFRKHNRARRTKPEKAAGLAVMGWSATYAFFQKGQTKVDHQVIEGNNATVFANGKRPDGKPAMIKIRLLREDGLWKVRTGIQSLTK